MLKEHIKKIDMFQWYMICAGLLFLITWVFTQNRMNLIMTLAFVFVIIAYKTTRKKNEEEKPKPAD